MIISSVVNAIAVAAQRMCYYIRITLHCITLIKVFQCDRES